MTHNRGESIDFEQICGDDVRKTGGKRKAAEQKQKSKDEREAKKRERENERTRKKIEEKEKRERKEASVPDLTWVTQ